MLLAARCPVCDEPGSAPCSACAATMRRASLVTPPPAVDRCLALLAYEGAARELVARLKYRNARASIAWLGGLMAALVDEAVDVVTWAPTTPSRRRGRGFDQAELLARDVAKRLRRPARSLLRRTNGAPQTGADAVTRRLAQPKFTAREGRGTVLLIDDVTTTGATISAAAQALKRAGASRVIALVAARTPPPGDLH